MKYYFEETLRRIIQILVGNELFDLPILYNIRILLYRIIFSISSNPTIGYQMRFYRSHRMKDGKIFVGKNVLLAKHVEIDYSGRVNIENDVWISEGAQIHTHNHPLNEKRYNHENNNIVATEITLKKGCWIGARAIILPNVKYIGENAIVGAGSVVTKSVESNMIVCGNPAKVVKIVDEADRIKKLEDCINDET